MPRTILIHLNVELDDNDNRTADEIGDLVEVALAVSNHSHSFNPLISAKSVSVPLAEDLGEELTSTREDWEMSR